LLYLLRNVEILIRFNNHRTEVIIKKPTAGGLQMKLAYTTEKLENSCPMDIFIRKYVDVPRFLECCKMCPNYNKKWSCPEFNFDQLSYWKQFKEIHLLGTKMILDESMRGSEYENPEINNYITIMIASEKGRLMQVIWDMEKKIPGSRGLFAGDCKLCKSCAKKEGKPCRNPDLMRYSVESIGGNVQAVTEELLGTQIRWVENGIIPPYFTLVCGLLLK
jgi:predicted metal-binding protein